MKDITPKKLKPKQKRSYSAASEAKAMGKHTGIKKLANGRFRARYFRGYDSATGKRVYPARTFDTEREARDWLASEWGAKGSSLVHGRGITVALYLDHWINTKAGIRGITRRSYKMAARKYIKPALGNIKLARLSAVQIESWQTELLKTLAPGTVQFARVVLHGALSSAYRKSIIRTNVIDATDGPAKAGIPKARIYPVTVEQALAIDALSDTVKYGVAFRIMLTCGLRPEEVIGLRWSDLELSAGRGHLRVRKVIQYVPGAAWEWGEPKTASGERSIVFPGSLATRLLEHRKAQLEAKLRTGGYWQENDLVICKPNGEPLRGSVLCYHFKKMLRQGGLPTEIRPYDLRHFFVTSSLAAEVDAKTVSREAGHSQVSFTLQRYGHVLPEMHEAACDKRERLLRNRK